MDQISQIKAEQRKPSKNLEKLTNEEIFNLLWSKKNCCFPEQIETLKYIYHKEIEKAGCPIMAANTLFMFGIMLGKAWERKGVKY